jgi:hypothetical protein
VAGKRYYTAHDPHGRTPSRLKRLGQTAQLEYMEAWFREYYEDPVNEMTRSEPEYHFVWGGPYNAYDELRNEFEALVPDDRIQELAKRLEIECIEWAPTGQKEQELGSVADETVAFPMWPSEPRLLGQRAVWDTATREVTEARDEVTTEYAPPRVALTGTMTAGSYAAGSLTASLAIRPTIYPMDPGDRVTVEDAVKLDVRTVEFRDSKEAIERLCSAIEHSNEIAREVGDKMVAEFRAGLEYIAGPKPSRKVLDLLLVNPLYAAAAIFAGSTVAELAKLALKALFKLISPDIDIAL